MADVKIETVDPHEIIIRIKQCDGMESELVHETVNHDTIQTVMNAILNDFGYTATFTPLKRKGGGGT